MIRVTDAPPATIIDNLPAELTDLVFSSDGTAYTADADKHNVHSIDVTLTPPVIADVPIKDPSPGPPAPPLSAPSALAIAKSTAGDILIVGDDTTANSTSFR